MNPVELPDPIDRVVIVECQEKLVTRLEWVRLANQLERMTGVGGEDDSVLVG